MDSSFEAKAYFDALATLDVAAANQKALDDAAKALKNPATSAEDLYKHGCDCADRKNDALAIHLFKAAVDRGHRDANFRFGLYCFEMFGRTGREIFADSAFPFFHQAAKHNHALAAFMIGHCHEFGIGTVGRKKHPREAVRWYERAAALGCEMAKARLEPLSARLPAEETPTASRKTGVFQLFAAAAMGVAGMARRLIGTPPRAEPSIGRFFDQPAQ